MISPKLLVIVGPTASGKTALAIKLAKKYNGEIICADSRTLYKEMNIGTAKPTKAEMKGIPHHMLDIIYPNENYNVAMFQEAAKKLIKEIYQRGKLPMLVGGSGLYIDSVIFDYQFSGVGQERDPVNPRHLKNPGEKQQELRRNTLIIGISPDKEILRERIEKRTRQMFAEGFEAEAKGLAKKYGWDAPGMHAPGYKAMREYMIMGVGLDEAIDRFIINDMQLAKRQRSWFKRNKYIHWLTTPDDAIELIEQFLAS